MEQRKTKTKNRAKQTNRNPYIKPWMVFRYQQALGYKARVVALHVHHIPSSLSVSFPFPPSLQFHMHTSTVFYEFSSLSLNYKFHKYRNVFTNLLLLSFQCSWENCCTVVQMKHWQNCMRIKKCVSFYFNEIYDFFQSHLWRYMPAYFSSSLVFWYKINFFNVFSGSNSRLMKF